MLVQNNHLYTRTERIEGDSWNEEQSFSCRLCGYLAAKKAVEMHPILLTCTPVERDESHPIHVSFCYFGMQVTIGIGEFHQMARD